MKKTLLTLFATMLLGVACAFGITACDGGNSSDTADQPHEHSYAATYTIEATCTEQGYTMYSCPCGEHMKAIT